MNYYTENKMNTVLVEIGLSNDVAKIIINFISEDEFENRKTTDDDGLTLFERKPLVACALLQAKPVGPLPKFDCFGCIILLLMTLTDSFEYARSVGVSTFQTFFGDAISTERQIFSKEDISKVKIDHPTFKCFSHAPFTFSLVETKETRGVFDIDSLKKKFNDPYAWRIAKAIDENSKLPKN